MRCSAAQALGLLLCRLAGQGAPPPAAQLVLQLLQGASASGRLLAGLVLCSWLRLVGEEVGVGRAPGGGRQQPPRQEQQPEQQQGQDQQQPPKQEQQPEQQPEQQGEEQGEEREHTCVSLAAGITQCVPGQLLEQCRAWLAAPGPSQPSPPGGAPYREVEKLYGRMRRDIVALLSMCLQVGWRGVGVAWAGGGAVLGPRRGLMQARVLDGRE